MNIVLETTSLQSAYHEKRDWQKLGHVARVTEKQKVFRGGFQKVYRVWVDRKVTKVGGS
jgi:hypothetical protein